MKRKIIFSSIFILNIILALYVILNANAIIGNYLNGYDFLNQFGNNYAKISEENIYSTYTALYIIQIIISIFSLIYILRGNILRKKGMFAVILFFLALNNLDLNSITKVMSLINVIFGFCLLITQRKNDDDYPIKRKLPHLEVHPLKKYQKVCMIILISVYFILLVLPKDLIHLGLSGNFKMIINITLYVFFTLFVVFIFKDKLKRDFKHLLKNFFDYFVPSLKIFGIVIICYFITSYFIHFVLSMPLPVNEIEVEKLNIYFLLFAGCIYAPVVEEGIFRGSLHYIFKNNIVFVVVSSLLFGLLHTYDEPNILSIIVQAIPYSVLGFFMAYNYSKTNNIAHTMMWHFAWNFITTIITTFIGI